MTIAHPDKNLIALGIRQPWVELILRGVKTIEVRSQNTQVRGPIYLYSAKKLAEIPAADAAIRKYQLDIESLPRGVLVGTVEIVETARCRPRDAAAACVPRALLKGQFAWRLGNARRLEQPLPVRFLPYGVWFYPFRRRNADRRV